MNLWFDINDVCLHLFHFHTKSETPHKCGVCTSGGLQKNSFRIEWILQYRPTYYTSWYIMAEKCSPHHTNLI